MAIDRRKAKEQLLKRTQESASKVDDSGRFSNIFRKDLNLPLWSCKEGTHVIDILPFIVGENYPTRTYPDVEKGTYTYLLDVFVHRGVGVNEDSYICPARNYNLPCAVCEDIAELRRGIDPDAKEDDPEDGETVKIIKANTPKRRVVYNIACWDNDKEIDKGVQIFEVAHFFMEKHLTALSEGIRGGGRVSFADFDDGVSIVFKREGSGVGTSYLGHRFEPRPEPVPDELFDSVYTLDEIIHIPSYEELYEAYHGRPYAADEGKTVERARAKADDEPVSRRRSRPTDDEAKTASTRGRSAETETQTRRGRAQEPEEPASTRRRGGRTEAAEPEQPVRSSRAAPASSGPVCPAGGVYAKDIDTLEHCGDCELWDDCARDNSATAKPAEPEKPKRRARR